jgi:hypothetical protein
MIIDITDPTIYPVTTDIDLESNRVLLDLAAFDQTPIDHFEIKVISPDGSIFRNLVLDHNRLREGTDRVEGSVEIFGPFDEGTYMIEITAKDAWGNSASTSTEFTILGETESGGTGPVLYILIGVFLVPLLAVIVYGLIRLFRRRNPTIN